MRKSKVHPSAPATVEGPGFFTNAGPLGTDPFGDQGGQCRGPFGLDPFQFAAPSVTTAPPDKPPLDADIEALNLSDKAKKAAYELKSKHPGVKFTSGRRDKKDQARAMASNVALNRTWIVETYIESEARDACQKWVDGHKDKKTKDEIAAGLTSVLEGLTDAQLTRLSKHLSGDAFDVQPVEKDAGKIKKTIRALPGVTKFLDKEGGLVRWHAQF